MHGWDQYKFVCKLGEGSYGTVMRAKHKVLGSSVAIKSINAWICDNLNVGDQNGVFNTGNKIGNKTGNRNGVSNALNNKIGNKTPHISNNGDPLNKIVHKTPHISNNADLKSIGNNGVVCEKAKYKKQLAFLCHEARILASLDHPCIVSLLEICSHDEGPFGLVLEDLGQTPLSLLISNNTKLCDSLVGCILSQITEAVVYMHARMLMHRDIKPENIMVIDKVIMFEIFFWL